MTERVEGHRVHWMAACAALLEGDELEALVDSIRRSEQQEPIVARRVAGELEILDGRNRLRACRIAGVQPLVRDLGEISDEEAERVVEAAHTRRHETASAKALRAYRWLPRYGGVIPAAAKACGVSHELVRQAARLHEAAQESPDAGALVELVEAGRCPLSTAHKAVREDVDLGGFVDRLTSNNVSAATALKEARGGGTAHEPEPEPVSDEALDVWSAALEDDAGARGMWLRLLARAVLGPADAGEARTLLRRAVVEAAQ